MSPTETEPSEDNTSQETAAASESDTAANAPEAASDAASAGADVEPEKLDGEDADRLVGIMYSDISWEVKPWMKASFFWFAVFLVVLLGGYITDKRLTFARLQMDQVVEPTPITGVTISKYDFMLPKGEKNEGLSLSQLKGKWVFLNFWATWCPPCRDEMPSMEMLNRRLTRDHAGKFAMVAVSVDEDWAEVKRFFGQTQPTFEVLWDRRKTAARKWGTRKFPETYLIDPEGNVVAKFIGPRDWYNEGSVNYFDGVISGRRKPS